MGFQPNIALALSEEGDGSMSGTSNFHTVNAPVSFVHTLNQYFNVALQTGLVLPFDQPGKRFFVPFSAGINFTPGETVAVLAALSFKSLIGGDRVDDGIDERTLTVATALSF